jgi:signal transduction histidine kinase
MRITSRRGTIVFFLCLGIGLVALAVALNVGWIILNWREGVLLFFGIIFFAVIIAGMIVNTTFLLREIRRNEQHDSFINAVTHELKTPVASIRLHLETLQRRDLPEAQRQEFYRLMLRDTDRLTDTVEQVLRAGRAGDKKAGKEKVEVDFRQVVRDCMDVARTRHSLPPDALRYEEAGASAAGVAAGTAGTNGAGTNAAGALVAGANGARLNGTPVRVQGSAEDLRTAVLNLLDNAIKYSGENVDVRVRLETPDEKHVVLSVQDQGVGISPDDVKLIFRRFYRVSHRSLAHVKGTGLGLFIVKAIVQKHGGKVFAESEGEGQGTTVTLQLPRMTSPEPTA